MQARSGETEYRAQGAQEMDVHGRRYDLVILDVHGTMTSNSTRTVTAAHAAGHDVLGKHFGAQFYQDLLARDKDVTLRDHFRRTLPEATDEQVKQLKQRFDEVMEETYKPIPGIPQAVKEMEEMGAHVVVLTNGNHIDKIKAALQRWKLERLAEEIWGSHNMRIKKPHRETVDIINADHAKRFGKLADPSRILVVGDYRGDIETAHAAGADSVLILIGRTADITDPKPTYVIHNPRDIAKIVKGQIPPTHQDRYTAPSVLWAQNGNGENIRRS